jgi:lipopolysaccharide transport system ATP-binding protein
MPPAIRVEGLSKLYRIGTRKQAYHTLRETLSEAGQAAWRSACRAAARAATAWRANGRSPTTPAATGVSPNGATQGTDGAEGRLDATPRLEGDHFWALKDVSFEVQPGEVVGIIGRNGAGKSTLLKILSRITEPTAGRVELRGRVGSLLEVGTGFHPELTGRENIYLNGSILGMSRREIQRKFDEIVAFAEIEDFLDTPVKRYSSGMYVRLAFAVAAHLEPEILIVDEVLAVGDAAFQQKCHQKLASLRRAGLTIFFISHNLGIIKSLCTRAVLLEHGRYKFDGTPEDTVRKYLHSLKSRTTQPVAQIQDREGGIQGRLLGISFSDSNGHPIDSIVSGFPVIVQLQFAATQRLPVTYIALSCFSSDHIKVFHIDTTQTAFVLNDYGSLCTRICTITHLPLTPGTYRWNGMIASGDVVLDHVYDAAELTVLPSDFYRTGSRVNYGGGIILAQHRWE